MLVQVSEDTNSSQSLVQQLQKLNLTPDQLQYLSQLNNANNAPSVAEQTNQNLQQVNTDQKSQSQNTGAAYEAAVVTNQKNQKPIDKLEAEGQPADNDDDEKLADNHRKLAKITMKQDEIKKLEDTHNSLTKDALKQAQSGASMKKVQHNLKIAKSVRKRVEDLKQQVASDQMQLQNVKNVEQIA